MIARRDRSAGRAAVKGFCAIPGLDPLYLANEGKSAMVVPDEGAEADLAAMRAHPAGRRRRRPTGS